MYCRNNLHYAWCFLFFWTAAVFAGPTLDSANALYTQGKLIKSIKLYKKALSKGENPALCYFNCANAYFQLDSLSRALMFYRQCIHEAPDFVKARLNSAIIYYMLGDLGRCIAASKQTLRMDPENQKLRLVLAAAFAKSGTLTNVSTLAGFIQIKNREWKPFVIMLNNDRKKRGAVMNIIGRYYDS